LMSKRGNGRSVWAVVDEVMSKMSGAKRFPAWPSLDFVGFESDQQAGQAKVGR
jgi:hypothetical protein